MSEVDFEKDLPVYIRNQFPKISVQSAACLQISKLLNVIHVRLLREMAGAKKKSLLHASQFAAEKILPKYLVRLAKSEALRQLALYEIGVLEYSGSTNARADGRRMSSSKTKNATTAKGAAGKKGKGSKKEIDPVTGLRVKRRATVVSPFTAFKQGISKLHSLSHSYQGIEGDGGQYLSSSLYYFTKTFASKLALQEPKHQIGPVEMRNALMDFLGPNVFRSAVAEGNKCLMLHENDLIKFDPRDINKRDPKMFSSPLETHSFRPGIHFLLKNRFSRPFAAVDNSSEYVEHVLLEVARLFGTEVGGNCVRAKMEFLDETDIRSVMEDILPGELRRHAIARASKALADYVAETSLLYHSSIDNVAGTLPGMTKRRSFSSPKRRKSEVKTIRKSSKTDVAVRTTTRSSLPPKPKKRKVETKTIRKPSKSNVTIRPTTRKGPK